MSKILYVEWEDSCGPGGVWHDPDDFGQPADNLAMCFSVGVLVNEDAKAITLAGHWANSPKLIAGVLTIPKSAIRKRRTLRVK